MEARLTGISREEALRYLGIRKRPDENLLRDLDRCADLLVSSVRPRICWRLFTREADGSLSGTSFRPAGEDICRFLAGCGQVIGMAATLGAESETLLRRMQEVNMADAVILDALASAAVENVCDNLCADLALEVAPRKLTSRFSPGYGDFPLSQQAELCAVLNVNRLLGITLTPGGLMVPQKSVTALIGVRQAETDPVRNTDPEILSGCSACSSFPHCRYKKEDQPCGK